MTNNPIFTLDEIKGFFEIFNFYADERREANIADMTQTAKILGLDKKNPLIYEAFSQISNETEGSWVRFEEFLTLLTNKLVKNHLFREILNPKKVGELCLNWLIWKVKKNLQSVIF